MGQAEHDHNNRVTPGETNADWDRLSDSEDEGDNVLIEKSKEQLTEEAIQAWMRFRYPGWATPLIYVMFLCSLINTVLTLDQWHGTHSWRLPFDLFPEIFVQGGWNDDGVRWAACIIGLLTACYTLVQNPTADKFKVTFLALFASATLHCVAFGRDLFHLTRATERPECADFKVELSVRKYHCVFDRYRATVIMDILAGVAGYLLAFFVLYQALTGVVSRRTIYNERTQQWDKITLGPDDEAWVAFPKEYRKQRKPFLLFTLFVTVLNGIVLGLTVTQSTHEFLQFPGSTTPTKNFDRNTPRDLYILPGNQANGVGHGLGTGSWPEENFNLRLSANTVALVTLAFLIQWRRDGRFAQLFVLLLLFCGAVLYLSAFFIDFDDLDQAESQGTEWAKANGHDFVQHRYIAVVIFDGFCGFMMILFALYNLLQYFMQCKEPLNKTEARPYGWYCCGEWAAKKEQKAARKALERDLD